MAKRAKRKSKRPEARASTRRDNVIQLPVAVRNDGVSAAASSDMTSAARHELEASDDAPLHQTTSTSDIRELSAPAVSRETTDDDAAETDDADQRVTIPGLDDEHEEAERFFSSHPPEAKAHAAEDFADLEHDNDATPRHGGLWVTVAIGLVGVLMIGGFLVYHKLLMPTPEDLGRGTVALPTPETLSGVPAAPTAERVEASATAKGAASVEAAPSEAVAQVAQAEPNEAAPQGDEGAPQRDEAAPQGDAVQHDEAMATLSERDRASYEQLLGQAREQGFKKNAEATYMQALTIHPTGSEALSGLAMLYLNQGKNTDARDRAEQAVQADAQSSEAWIVLGAARGALGDAAGAREAYGRCADIPEGKYVGECKRMLR